MATTKGAVKAPTVAKKQPKPEQPVIQMPSKKKVCILGFADNKVQAPWDDDSYEFWGINEMWADSAIKKMDVVFELHDYKWLQEGKKVEGHYDWLKNNKEKPIFMQQHFDDIPMSIPFPREDIKKQFRHYFTNTISWEIAFAIFLGFKEIRLYGVNMATAVEYEGQRPSVEYYLGLAEGRGIKVYVPPESDLMKCMYDYGFEDGELSMMATKLAAEKDSQLSKAGQMQAQLNGIVAAMNQANGAAGAIEYVMKAFLYPNANFKAEKK